MRVAGAARQRDLVGVLVVVLVAEADQAEVDHADPAVAADQDVVGLDVAVDKARRVRRRQAARRLGEHGRDLRASPDAAPRAMSGRVMPVTNSMATNTSSPWKPTSWIWTTFGCDSLASAWASRSSRSCQRVFGSPSARASASLTATLRSSCGIVGRVDHSHRPGAEAAREQREATDPSRLDGRLVVRGLAAGTVVGCPKGHTGQPGDSDARAESGLPRA